MKRKAQTAEFKPPMQRFNRLNRRGSTEGASPGETAEISTTDTKHCEEKSPRANEQELDSGLLEIHGEGEQATVVITGRVEPNDIQYKPQDGSASDSVKHLEGVEMEAKGYDASSPEGQASHVSHSCRYSSDEAGDDLLCGAVEENMIKRLDEVGTDVSLDDVSGTTVMPSKNCEDPPAKKRLRRRMGMCGLGDRKRRSFVEGPQCRQSLTGAEREESAGMTGKDNGDISKNISLVENYGSGLMEDEGTAEQVLLEQSHRSQQMMTEEASLPGLDIQVVQDHLSATAMTSDHETEPAVSDNELDLQGIGTGCGGQGMEIGMKKKDLLEEEELLACSKVTEDTSGVAEETTTEYPVDEELSYGNTEVTDEDGKGLNETAEHQGEGPEDPISGSQGVTSEVCGDFKETSHRLVAGFKCATSKVCEGSTNAMPENENGGCTGVTDEVSEGSTVIAECFVDAEVYNSCTGPEENPNGSIDATEVPADELSLGSACVPEDCEGSTEPIAHPFDEVVILGSSIISEEFEVSTGTIAQPVDEEVILRSSIITEDFEVSTEPIAHSVDEVVILGSSIITEDCEGSTDPIEHPFDEVVILGSSIITEDCGASPEPVEHPVAGGVILGSSIITEDCEGSTEPIEHPFDEVVILGSSVITEDCGGSPEPVEHSVAGGVILGSSIITEDCGGSTESIEHPVAGGVNYGSTSDSGVGAGSTDPSVCPSKAAEEVSNDSIAVSNKVSEGSEEPTENTAAVTEKINVGSSIVTDEDPEGAKELTLHPTEVTEQLTNGICEGSNERMDGVQITEEVSCVSPAVTYEGFEEGYKEPTEQPVEVAEEESYGCAAVNDGVSEGSGEVAEKMNYSSPAEVCDGPIQISKEVLDAITALEESEMELEGHCPPDGITHLCPSVNLSTEEQDQSGPQLTVSGLPSETCDTESQFEHMKLPKVPPTAAPWRTEPGGKCNSSPQKQSVPTAPPADLEKCMNDLLDQDICDPLVIPVVAKQEASNPTLTLASTECPQDNSIPSSLYSVTDSQLNSIVLGMELEDQPAPEAFLHQEDATELVCGLIKELSSLNRTVMAAHKEIELLRRGSRSPKAPVRRIYGLRNSEM